jgi:hypothetical protein
MLIMALEELRYYEGSYLVDLDLLQPHEALENSYFESNLKPHFDLILSTFEYPQVVVRTV